MQVVIKSRNYTLESGAKDYLEKKLNKLQKYFDRIIKAEAEITQGKETSGKKKIEVMLEVAGKTLMAEDISDDIFSLADKVVEKLEKQIKKHKEKLKHMDKSRTKTPKKVHRIDTHLEDEFHPQIVKTKRFAIKPMDVEEAAEQMILLGHSFFVFLNSKNEKINVLYKRKDGNFGLIEPEF